MKRLVIDSNNWLDLKDDEQITLNGNLVRASSITSNDVGGTVTNVLSKKFTHGVPTNGTLTNVATFEG